MPVKLQRWGSMLVFTLLVLAPLTFLPPSVLLYNSLDTPRRLLMLLGAGLLAGLILKAWSDRRRLVLRWHPLDLPVLLFFFASVISSIGGAFWRISFCGPVWSQDGLVLLWIGVIFYFAIKEFLRDPRELELAATIMVLVGGCSALLGLLDWVCPLNFNPSFTGTALQSLADRRLVATLGNPMFTGTYFAVLIPMGAGVAIATQNLLRRVLVLCSVAVMLPALLLTLARASWIGFGLMLVIMLIVLAVCMGDTLRAIPLPVRVTTGVLLVAFVLIGVSIPHVRARLLSIVNLGGGGTIATRIVYMRTSLNMFMARPIQGVGVGNIRMVFPQYRPSSLAMEQDLPLNRGYNDALPHNLFIQVAAETGLLGLIPFLWLIVTLFRSGFAALRAPTRAVWLSFGLFGALTAYLCCNLSAFDNFATSLLFWTALGLLAAGSAQERALPERFGPLAEALTPRLVSIFNIASLVVAIGVALQFTLQLSAAYLTQHGLAMLNDMQMQQQAQQPIRDPLGITEQAVDDVKMGIALTFGSDYTGYKVLFLAYQYQLDTISGMYTQMTATGQTAEAQKLVPISQQTQQAMLDAGKQTLQLMDREAAVLRLLVMMYTKSDKPGDLQEARQLVNRLESYEPMSAEVCLIAADLAEREGNLDTAINEVNRAIELDPTFSTAWAKLAHMKNEQVKRQDPNGEQLLHDVCAHYEKAMALGLELQPSDRLEYTTALLLLQREKAAINAARPLRGTSQFNDLLDKIKIIYKIYKRAADGDRVIREMQGNATPPPSAPPAPANVQGPALQGPALPLPTR